MFVAIRDDANDVSIHVDSETEGYAPDVMDDLSSRAVRVYRETLTTKAGVEIGIQSVVEELEGE